MSKPITISYLWNQERFEKFFDDSYTFHYKNSPRRYVGWFFIALLQFGVVGALKAGEITILLFASFMLLYWYGIKKYLVKKRALKAFEASDFKDKKIELTVNEEGITQNGHLTSWDEVEYLESIGDGVELKVASNLYSIPSAGFKTIEERNALKKLAKKKGKL